MSIMSPIDGSPPQPPNKTKKLNNKQTKLKALGRGTQKDKYTKMTKANKPKFLKDKKVK